MRSLIYLLVCSLGVSAAAQTVLPLDASLPADKGRGEAKTELRLRFNEPLKILKRDTEHGFLHLMGGRPVSEAKKDTFLNHVSTTACTLVLTPKITLVGGDLDLQLDDMTLAAELAINDVHYRTTAFSSWNGSESVSINGVADANISFVQNENIDQTGGLAAIVVSRSYVGLRDNQALEKALTVSPASLRDCLGVSVDVIEVEATRK